MRRTTECIFTIVALVLMALTLPGYSATLYRTSFEAGTGSPLFPDAASGDVDINDGNYGGWNGGSDGFHVITSDDAHNGSQSLKVTDFGSAPYIDLSTQTNKDVYITFWTKSATNGEATRLFLQTSTGGAVTEIAISSTDDITVNADNVWGAAGIFDVGTDWFAMQVKLIWNGSSSKYDQQMISVANIGDATWTTVGTSATRFDQPDFARVMITKMNGSDIAFIDNLTITEESIAPNPDAVIVYETGFEGGTGVFPFWPFITTTEFNMVNGYDGWSGGSTPNMHVVSASDAISGAQSYKACGWGSSQPSKTISTQSGHDLYFRFWTKCADNGEYTFLLTKQSSGATMSEIKISSDNDFEVSADNVWGSVGSFDVSTNWFAVQIQWHWNGSTHKYDQQTFYAANVGDADWTTVGTAHTRFDQANFATFSLFKEDGLKNAAYYDELIFSDQPISPAPISRGALIIIK